MFISMTKTKFQKVKHINNIIAFINISWSFSALHRLQRLFKPTAKYPNKTKHFHIFSFRFLPPVVLLLSILPGALTLLT